MLLPLLGVGAADVNITLQGLESGHVAVINVSSEKFLKTFDADHNGTYTVDVPEGKHAVKVEIAGYDLPDAKQLIVEEDGTVHPALGIHLTITKKSADADTWNYSWRDDGSIAGATESSSVNVVKPAAVEFLGKMIVPADVPSAQILFDEYRIILSDEEEKWTNEFAYRLLETVKPLVQWPIYDYHAKFVLTSDYLDRDIEVRDMGNHNFEVRITKDAFYYANPFLVTLDGVRGKFFSKRLHHAVINYATQFGENAWYCNILLQDLYGCSIYPPSYTELTAGITDENEHSFQEFKPTELVSIINMLEELPEGFHKTPHLNYLIRRQDGMKHPLYPEAAAVSWCVDNGYIEFMGSAFGGSNLNFETLRLILHEKTHFLWEYSFSEEIKNDWAEIGGWYRDLTSISGWRTTKEVEFVTSYAHAHNPNEDMAESVAFYLKDPDKLLARSEAKYNFIRDRIMHGTRYITTIPDHLTFEVLNLWPDYDFPGKIKSLEVDVKGAPEEDKLVHVKITLNHVEGNNDGATRGFANIFSPTFIDSNGSQQQHKMPIPLEPVNGDLWTLEGYYELGKHYKSGYWNDAEIRLSDDAGNERFGNTDVMWNTYIDNPLEDLIAPTANFNGLRYELRDDIVDGENVQILRAIIPDVEDNYDVRGNISIYNDGMTDNNYGGMGAETWYDPEKKELIGELVIKDYFQTGNYYVTSCHISDPVDNLLYAWYSEDPDAEFKRKGIYVKTPNPDSVPPEVDLNRITVYAQPTHPDAPDGETLVTMTFYVRDDRSGFSLGRYYLIDPNGTFLEGWFQTNIPNGEANKWHKCTVETLLPQGSVPGIWGLYGVTTIDNVGNCHDYNFAETLIFEPDDDTSNYILFADMDDDEQLLYFRFEQQEGLIRGIDYRIICEETGEEIAGIIYNSANAPRRSPSRTGAPEANDFTGLIDVSPLPDGKLIIIAKGLDEEGGVLCVKSAVVEKKTLIAGDVNADRKCTITDITITVGHIMGTLGEGNKFYAEAADIDKDGQVLVNDLTAIIDLVLAADNASSAPARAPQKESDANLSVFEMCETNGSTINVAIKPGYIATQLDVILPEGVNLTKATLVGNNAQTHKMTYSHLGDGRLRVVIYSMENVELTDNLVRLTLQGEGEVLLTNALVNELEGDGKIVEKAAADARATVSGNATGIEGLTIDQLTTDDCMYNLNGQKVSADYKGIVIKRGNKVVNGQR